MEQTTQLSTDPIPDDESLLQSLANDPEFAACIARLERHWPKPKLLSPMPVLQRLGRFEIRRELGRGRFGVVFLAWDPQLQRQVALKVPQFDAAMDPELRERFRGEALATSKLQHPGIVSLFDVGQHAGVDYLAMAYVEGTTLAERLKLGTFPPMEAAKIGRQLAEAVHHAHEQDVIHRDLKPSNVLLDSQDQPHVMDFGLARRLADSEMRATATGQVIGTPAYMPPEQATGRGNIGPTSDVYSLGVILYEMLTGRPPFQASTFVEVVEFILNRDPLPPSKLNPKVPRELDAITLKCLEKPQASRYATANDLADDLQRYLDGRPIRAKSQGLVRQGLRWCRKHPSQALLLVVTTLLIGLALATGGIYARLQRAGEVATQQKTIADTQRSFATLQRAQNIIGRRATGWSQQGLDEIRTAASHGSGLDPVELRSLAVKCLSGFDLRREATLPTDMLIGRIAFSADGALLAVGELKGKASSRVVVYDATTQQVLHEFSNFSLEDNLARIFLKGETKKWEDGVRELAFSPDSRFLAAGMRFGNVLVFDLSQPQSPPRLLTVTGERELYRLRFSSDGNCIYAITKSDQFLHWPDWQNKNQPQTPWKESVANLAVATHADRFFTRATGDTLRMRDCTLAAKENYSPIAQFPKGQESDLATDARGRLLAGESEYGLRVYDAETGSLLRRIADNAFAEDGFVSDLAMSADGQLLAAFDLSGVVRLFDVSAGRQVHTLTIGRHDFQNVALDPHKRRLVVANDNTLEFWRIHDAPIRRVLNHPVDQLYVAQFAADGHQILGAAQVGTFHGQMRYSLLAYDCATGELKARVDSGFDHVYLEANVAQVAWHPQRSEVAWSSPLGVQRLAQEVDRCWQIREPTPLVGQCLPVEVKRSDSDSDDSSKAISFCLRLPSKLTLTKQIPVLVLNVQATGESLLSPPLTCKVSIEGLKPNSQALPPWLLSQQPAGEQQWAIQLPHHQANWQEATLHIVPSSQLTSFQIERAHVVLLDIVGAGRAFPTTRVVEQLSFAAAGDKIWGASESEVVAWTWPEGKRVGHWKNPQHFFSGAGHVRALQAGKTGTLVGTRDGVVYWLSPDAGKTLGVWPSGGEEVTSLALCEKANVALVAADNGKVRTLTIPGGHVEQDLIAAESALLALAATPDAKWLATASVDCQLKLWRSTANGFELYCQLPDTANTVRSLQLSADGKYLSVLGRATASVELWDLAQLSSEFRRLEIE